MGVNYVNGELTGDIVFNEISVNKCKCITPVPGGVGPLTITMLLSNLIKSKNLRS